MGRRRPRRARSTHRARSAGRTRPHPGTRLRNGPSPTITRGRPSVAATSSGIALLLREAADVEHVRWLVWLTRPRAVSPRRSGRRECRAHRGGAHPRPARSRAEDDPRTANQRPEERPAHAARAPHPCPRAGARTASGSRAPRSPTGASGRGRDRHPAQHGELRAHTRAERAAGAARARDVRGCSPGSRGRTRGRSAGTTPARRPRRRRPRRGGARPRPERSTPATSSGVRGYEVVRTRTRIRRAQAGRAVRRRPAPRPRAPRRRRSSRTSS